MGDKIAIQGYKGSFHDIALNKLYGKKPKEVVYCKTIINVFEALENDLADYALAAIGNNHYGDVNHVNDILINNRILSSKPYFIIGEVYINISHCLLAIKGTKISDIRTIYSQAPAIIQCFNFLHSRLNNVIVVEQDDTSLSAKLVSEIKNKTVAAIASKEAAKIFDLDVLAEDIQDDINDIYRFVLIGLNKPISYKKASRTSLLLSTHHKIGELAKALDLLAVNHINLSYLQSIPIANRPFEYRFHIIIDAGAEDKRVIKVMQEINRLGYQLDILGSYKKASLPKLANTHKRLKVW